MISLIASTRTTPRRHAFVLPTTASVYLSASIASAALVGVAVSGAGFAATGASTAVWAILVGAAAIYALSSASLVFAPVPVRHWQVPPGWVAGRQYKAAALWGVLLGPGVFTYMPYPGFWLMLVWLGLQGSITLGLIVGGSFGMARASPLILRAMFGAGTPSNPLLAMSYRGLWHYAEAATLAALVAAMLTPRLTGA